jgi:hypothetical protein
MVQSTATDLREALADLAHQQWSGWMDYLFSKCEMNEDGTATIPAWAVERWQHQIKTPYRELSEPEKNNDRHEADRVLLIIAEKLT